VSPRDRRLLTDRRQMEEFASQAPVTFRADGDPPELYHLMFSVTGVALDEDRCLVTRALHRCDAYLHKDYPRRPPVLTWKTPIFHPNILGPDRNGGVCIGGWSAAESLADLCWRLCDLISYRAFNADDALDQDAAEWARHNAITPGSDLSSWTGSYAGQPEVRVRA
jgi:ubiquitin-protein ligase